jgi:4-hydroxy-tetrahydrodipicolinate reductase
MDLRIGVTGAAGRMGRMLVREIVAREGCALAGASERAGHPALGQDAGEVAGIGALGLPIRSDNRALFDASDAVIDFTAPSGSLANAREAARAGRVLVIGTTGFSTEDDGAIAEAARHATIVKAPNMSLVVNLLFALAEQVAERLGPEFDAEILEIHHRHKVDAPSGTALALGEAVARGRKIDLARMAERGRDGHTGARRVGAIGFASLRAGNEVGDHTVMFVGESERLELTHKAASRQIYASGAVRAALWARGKPPGLYGMRDVLGLG